MPAINRTLSLRPSTSKPLIVHLTRHSLSTSSPVYTSRDNFHRPEYQTQGAGYSAAYEPGQPTQGPLSKAAAHGAPRLTPSLLKEHLDKYVVGQDKAKKVTTVAIYNHYQRIQEIRRQESEEQKKREQQARWELRERERESHPVENEYPGHVETVDLNSPYRPPLSHANSSSHPPPEPELGTHPLNDPQANKPLIEKSNLLLLGPSGVGKTYILSTLARILEVPFATIDCSSLTQAGYIGTDIESSLERLLLSSSHSISRCESGIIFFDEVDKLAKPAIMTHGRDVSGEGVQQGLLKMIEGTSVTVNLKGERSSKTEKAGNGGGIGPGNGTGAGGGKSEQYTIDTTNILFVFAGAFIGLEKIIASRLSSGSSLGFGSPLKTPSLPSPSSKSTSKSLTTVPKNPLENVTPPDLQTYGLIPELLGRIPILCPLTPLSLSNLVSILTEPRNALTKQYIALFATYGIQLKFTTASLHAIAERAMGASSTGKAGESTSGIGARGLRSIMESVLGEIMFWGPGSGIRFCLVDEKFVKEQGKSSSSSSNSLPDSTEEGDGHGEDKMPKVWSRGQGRLFDEAFVKEEEEWRVRMGVEEGEGKEGDKEELRTFEALRSVGSSGM